jgi:hypothetical protein
MRIALAITIALLPALAAAQTPVLGVSPTSLTFIAAAGDEPSSRTEGARLDEAYLPLGR